MRTSEKQVKPIEIDDINIIENEKNQKKRLLQLH